jgi:hypothetical protein
MYVTRKQALVGKLDVKQASLPSTLSALGYIALLKHDVFKPFWTNVIEDFISKQLLKVCSAI